MGHRGRATVSDFPSLEPSNEPSIATTWTDSVACRRAHGLRAVAVARRSGGQRVDGWPPARGDPAPDTSHTLELAGEPAAPTPAAPLGWSDVIRHVKAAAAIVSDWLEPQIGPSGFSGLSPQSTTDGWPHHGSTVIRLVGAPADRVVAVVGARTRWDRLRLTGAKLEPMRYDCGWTTTGRLRVPWTPVPVRVELRIQPAAGDRTWVHLVLASRARYPRRYWSGGHDALGAIDTRARRP